MRGVQAVGVAGFDHQLQMNVANRDVLVLTAGHFQLQLHSLQKGMTGRASAKYKQGRGSAIPRPPGWKVIEVGRNVTDTGGRCGLHPLTHMRVANSPGPLGNSNSAGDGVP